MEIEFYFLDNTYEVIGREPVIIIWGITRDGKRIVLNDKRFRPYFYAILEDNVNIDEVIKKIKQLTEPGSPITNIEVVDKKYYGSKVKALKITTVIPEYVRNYRDSVSKIPGVKDVVEADIRFSMRYIVDYDLKPCGWHVAEVREVPKKPGYRVDAEYEIIGNIKSLEDTTPPSGLRIVAFDIEVYSREGSPRSSTDPVIVIGVINNQGEIRQFIAEDRDDRKPIIEFIEYIKNYDPDIIVGYNSNGFDWPYLLERCKYLGITLDVSRRINSPPQTSTYGHVSIAGRLNVDLYNFAEEITEVKIKSLDNVADYLGIMKKSDRVLIDYLEIPKYWDNPALREKILKYNRDDLVSTYGLAEKFLPFAMQLANITGLPLDQVGAASVGFRLEWYMMKQAYRFNELAPNRVERPPISYRGAVVLKPLKGIHRNIAVLDFTSMYPNIMIKYNVGPDTIIKTNICSDEKHYVAPEVKHCFNREPPGFFKRVLETLLKLRREVREIMKKYSLDSYEYRVLDERQRALKILANATYGYMGWVHARWYCRECAEAVTAWGRQTITTAIDYARKIGLRVIYGDTDSLFVEYIEDKINELIKIVDEKLGFDIKIDKIYDKVFFTEVKKRYAGLDKEGRVDIVGFEAVRGDWAEIAKEVQEKVTEILLKKGSIDEAIKYVQEVIKDLRNSRIPLDKLVIWKTLTKKLEEYSVDAPHVVAARKLIKAGIKVSINDKVGYVVLKGLGKISNRVEPYVFVKDLSRIDIDYYVDHQVIPAALRILSYFGVSETQLRKTSTSGKSLFDYFGKGKK